MALIGPAIAAVGAAASAAAGAFAAFASTSFGQLALTVAANLLFAPKAPNTEGPRLGDLTVTTSAYGNVIPLFYGSPRMSGNIIWASDLVERKKTASVGGKGFGGPKHTTYQYFANLAVSFGVGPADGVVRIWMNQTLVFDRSAGSDAETLDGLVFRFYPGDETQLPDPLIESYVGVDNTPAYRGQCYIVFESLPLAGFGNSIPNITAEIAKDVTVTSPSVVSGVPLVGETLQDTSSTPMALDWERRYVYVIDTSGDETQTGIRRFRLSDMHEDRQMRCYDMWDSPGSNEAIWNGIVALGNGDLVTQIRDGAGHNAEKMVLLSGVSWHEKSRFGVSGSSTTFSDTGFSRITDIAALELLGLFGKEYFVICKSQFSSYGVLAANHLDVGGLSHVWNSDTSYGSPGTVGTMQSVCAGLSGEGFCEAYAFHTSGSTLSIDRLKIGSNSLGGSITSAYGVTVDRKSLVPSDVVAGGSSFTTPGTGPIYDPFDDTLIFACIVDGSTHYMVKYDWNADQVVWVTQVAAAAGSTRQIWSQSRIRNNTFGWAISGLVYQIDTRTGELLLDGVDFGVTQIAGMRGGYDSKTQTFIGFTNSTSTVVGKWQMDKLTADPADLADIVTDVCEHDGLVSADLDVTDLTGTNVDSYAITRQSSGRAAISILATAFEFDGIESDFKIKFQDRGQSVTRTITEDELAITNEELGTTVLETREDEVELPTRVAISYIDSDNDDQVGTQYYRRIINPTPVVSSLNEAAIEIPVGSSADFMKQLAQKKLIQAWVERQTYHGMFSWKHVDLDPADVINLSMNSGETYRVRLAKSAIGADYQIEFDAVAEDADQYTSDLTADAGSGMGGQKVPDNGPTAVFMPNTPLLRDSDSSDRTALRHYVWLAGYSPVGDWTGASLFKSSDATTWDETARSTNPATWGSCLNALGDPPDDDPYKLDETNTLRVMLTTADDELVSASDAEFAAGANSALLVRSTGEVEVIRFKNVTDNGDGTYTLDTLVRGRRGTDTMCFGHENGETFIYLSPLDGQVFSLGLDQLDTAVYYRAVSDGKLISEADTQLMTDDGSTLKPYAVAYQEATIDGSNNITLTWARQTRVGGPLKSKTATVPLAEDTEEYEIDIYDGPGGSIVRTVTGLSSPTYTYSAANQVTDGFSPPLATLTVKIYQISAQVGRGYSRETTVNVI